MFGVLHHLISHLKSCIEKSSSSKTTEWVLKAIERKGLAYYMLSSMGFKAINPTISNTIAELFLLSVQNTLHAGKKGHILI